MDSRLKLWGLGLGVATLATVCTIGPASAENANLYYGSPTRKATANYIDDENMFCVKVENAVQPAYASATMWERLGNFNYQREYVVDHVGGTNTCVPHPDRGDDCTATQYWYLKIQFVDSQGNSMGKTSTETFCD